MIEKDFAKPFVTKISFCAGQSQNKNLNSVDHIQIDKMAKAFEEGEKNVLLIKRAQTIQELNSNNMKRLVRQFEKAELQAKKSSNQILSALGKNISQKMKK